MRRAPSLPLAWVLFCLLATDFALHACASSGTHPSGARQERPWTPGDYDLLVTLSYRMDTEATTRLERDQFTAHLTVSDDGTMTLQSSSGLCRQPTPSEIAADRARGGRTFQCQEVSYFLEPSAGTVGGRVWVSVQEGYRTQGPCLRYQTTISGDRVCTEYSWIVDYRSTSKRGSLKVTRRG